MGKVFENLTLEELCDLMCGSPEREGYCTAGADVVCDGVCEECRYYDEGDEWSIMEI